MFPVPRTTISSFLSNWPQFLAPSPPQAGIPSLRVQEGPPEPGPGRCPFPSPSSPVGAGLGCSWPGPGVFPTAFRGPLHSSTLNVSSGNKAFRNLSPQPTVQAEEVAQVVGRGVPLWFCGDRNPRPQLPSQLLWASRPAAEIWLNPLRDRAWKNKAVVTVGKATSTRCKVSHASVPSVSHEIFGQQDGQQDQNQPEGRSY